MWFLVAGDDVNNYDGYDCGDVDDDDGYNCGDVYDDDAGDCLLAREGCVLEVLPHSRLQKGKGMLRAG